MSTHSTKFAKSFAIAVAIMASACTAQIGETNPPDTTSDAGAVTPACATPECGRDVTSGGAPIPWFGLDPNALRVAPPSSDPYGYGAAGVGAPSPPSGKRTQENLR